MTNSRFYSIIYKEYILLRGSISLYFKLILFYWLLSFLGLYEISYTISMGQILVILATVSQFKQEETFWKYVIIHEKGRENAVYGRYIFTVLLTIVITMINLIIITFYQIFTGESVEIPLISLLFSTVLSLLLSSASLPLFYRLGSQKARPWFFLMVLIPLVLIVIYKPYITNSMEPFWRDGLSLDLFLLLFFLLFLVLILLFSSYLKSISLVKGKDFP